MRLEEYERRKEAAARAKEEEEPPRQPAQKTDFRLPPPRNR